MKWLKTISVGAIASCAAAHAQTGGWTIEVDGVVSPSSPSVTVNLYAWFDYEPGVAEVFAGAWLDLQASEEGWNGVNCPVSNTTSKCGMSMHVVGPTIENLHFAQLWIPAFGIYPDPSNPILSVAAEWETTDFTPREVLVETVNIVGMWVYSGPGPTNEVDPVIPGRVLIQVVPAPGAAAALVLGGATLVRRRRR